MRYTRRKLSVKDVQQIRTALNMGVSTLELMERYKISEASISKIRTGKSWTPERIQPCPGDILMHDAAGNPIWMTGILPSDVDYLTARGWRVVTP